MCFIMFAAIAVGCECANNFPQRESLRFAAVVFRGRVIQIEHLRFVFTQNSFQLEPELHPPKVDDHTLVTFAVKTYWKGAVTSVMKVYATARPSMCDGYRFTQGKEYIVYSNPTDWAGLDQLAPGVR